MTVLLVGVLQLALALHVRATLIDCAAEGARHGAMLESSPAVGVLRARELIGSALSPTYADDVTSTVSDLGGVPVLVVSVRAPLPIVGLLGPTGVVQVSGRALMET